MPTATATIGTIPALTQYQPGALPLSGDERFEIVSTGSATTAASYQMLITDIGKIPSVLPLSVPSQTDLLVFYDTSAGTPFSTRVSSLGGGGGGTGSLPAGGGTSELLFKLSDLDSDATWTGVAHFMGATGALYTTGSATSLVVGLATGGVSSTYIATGAVGSTQIATGGVSRSNIANFAIGSAQIDTGGVSGPNIANFAIGSTQLNTSGVVRANLTGFLIGSAQIDTSGIVRANFTNYAVGSTQIATGGIDRFNVATNAIGDAQLRTGAALSVIGNYSTAGGGVADITASTTNLFLQSTATGLLWGSPPTGTGTLTNGAAGQLLFGQNATTSPVWHTVSGAITTDANGSAFLGANVVTAANIATGAVRSTQIATSGIVRANFTNFAIGSAQVDTSGISGPNIANFAVSSSKIATGGVSGANIANFAVGSTQIATSGVVFANLTTVALGAALGGWGTTVINATVAPTLGSAGATGILALAGFSSGVVSIKPGAGTFASFNYVLPTTAGSAGYVLTAGVDATTAQTWTAVLTLNGTSQAFIGGMTMSAANLGTAISGTSITFNPGLSPIQRLINGGTATLVAPANDGELDVLVKNGAAAGALTFSGFTGLLNTGDTYTTTSGSTFFLSVRRASGVSAYRWFVVS